MTDGQDFRSELADFSGYPDSVRLNPDVDPNSPKKISGERWAFEASLVAGEIVRFAEGRHPDYGPYPIIVINDEEMGEVSVHAFHNVIVSALAENNPTPGERIGIRALGERQVEGTDRSYHNYEIRFPDRMEGGTPDFSRYVRRDTEAVRRVKEAEE